MRGSGPVEAPAIVFLDGGLMSGWTWQPVAERMQHYCCLVPDLPQYGKSVQQGPFRRHVDAWLSGGSLPSEISLSTS